MVHVWDRHAIMAAVRRKGHTLRSLALANKLEVSACFVALHRRNWKGERAIAAFLDVPLHELWPDRYSHVSQGQTSPPRTESTSQKIAAA